MREVNEVGLSLIKDFEGLRLEAYRCPAGYWTIGYGYTGPEIDSSTIWTQQEAEDALKRSTESTCRVIDMAVKVPLTDNEFGALVSFVYNVGAGNFRTSTLLKKLNLGAKQLAADELLRWNKIRGKVVPGLTRRREAERALFLS